MILSFVQRRRAVYKKAVISARPYIGFGENDEQAVIDAIDEWICVETEQ